MDVSKLLKTTSAGMLATKLDKSDGSSDGKIKGSVWNQFIDEIGTGTTIDENGAISVENAMRSITTYVVRQANSLGKNIEELVQSWSSKVSVPDSVEEEQDVEEADETEDTEETDEVEEETTAAETKISSQAQTDYNSIKVNLPKTRYSSREVKAILDNQNKGRALHDSLKNGSTVGLTAESVAHALRDDVKFGPNSQKQANAVINSLMNRIYQLEIKDKINNFEKRYIDFDLLSYKEQNGFIHECKNAIIAKENEIIRADNKEKTYYNNNRAKIQQTFDSANKLLADVANMNPKPEIETDGNSRKAFLPDGRGIKIVYDDNGEINGIFISYDTTQDHKNDGSTFDGFEMEYTPKGAYYNTDHSNSKAEGKLSSGYDFEQIKAIAKKIFE